MLEVDDLSVSYGGLVALSRVTLRVAEGQFVAIVGPNGAGKTTLFKAISGTVRPHSGTITFEGRDLLAVRPSERAHLGISHVPEGRQVFATLTVFENLEMGPILRAVAPNGSATSIGSTACFRSSPSVADSLLERCRAGSSKCSRSAAALLRRRGCCSWTNRPWGWRQQSPTRYSTASRHCTVRIN